MQLPPRAMTACLCFPCLLFLSACSAVGGGGANLTISVSAGMTTLQAGASTGLTANVMHSGGNPTVTWSLSGATCPNGCGAISSGANGEQYMAPDFAPASFMVTVTATAAADMTKSASVVLTVTHSLSVTCPSGNEGALSGPYAFLMGGGGSVGGIQVSGSIAADGKGNITAGLQDVNSKDSGPETGLTILAVQSLYSVGPDNRGCLGLVDSSNTVHIYRFALASFSSGVAASARLIEFDDSTGNGTRMEGYLARQDPTSFSNSALQGNYVFGMTGGDFSGGRYVSAGVCTAGAGTFGNGNLDSDDAGTLVTNQSGISGTYNVATTGRGTMTLNGQNFVLYMISASRWLAMASDSLDATHPLLSGQFQLQSGSFTNASLNSAAVLALTTFDPSGPTVGASVGLLTPNAAGSATQVLDTNSGGTYSPMQSSSFTYSVAANGRVAISGIAQPPVYYLWAPNHGYIVGTDSAATHGTLEPQAAGPFGNTLLSGTYAYGTEGTGVGGRLTAVGATTFDGMQNVQGTEDDSSPAGLVPNKPVSNTQYLFSSTSTVPGRGTMDVNNSINPSVAYIVSANKVIYINIPAAVTPATKPPLVIVEK